MLEIDLFVEDVRFSRAVPDLETFAQKAVRAAIAATPCAFVLSTSAAHDLSVRFADDETVRAENLAARGQDKPTNVLSFQYAAGGPEEIAARLRAQPGFTLGDIILSYDTCAREAAAQHKSLTAHSVHLLVHGTLHLLGYDHIENEAAEVMEQHERKILAGLGIADPYADPDLTALG